MQKSPWFPLLTLACATLGLALVLAHPAAADEEWTKIDCAGPDAHLQPPPGINANCFQGPFEMARGQLDCRLSNYSIGYPAEATEPRFYVHLRYPKGSGKVCSTVAFPHPEGAMKHVHKFVETDAKNWSAMQQVGNDVELMFFDAKNQKRDGKCFTFTKTGPQAGKSGMGHLFTMIGFFCKAPGQPLDAAAATALVNAIVVKPL